MFLYLKFHGMLVILLDQMLIGIKAIITNSGSTFFFTFSSAGMHWPELYALFSSSADQNLPDSKCKNVINNPHITDWFFTQRLENFIKHWLYRSLNACIGIDLNTKLEAVYIAMELQTVTFKW